MDGVVSEGRCLIIAEAGVNHNGDPDTAIKLCDAAKDAGADVVKFQTWITDEIITRDVEQADYQQRNTGKRESQYDMLKRLEMSFDDFITIKKHCDEIGIVFASTADDEKSLSFLVDIGIPFIKIGSGDIGNVPFLRKAGATGLPVILSTGMSTMDEVGASVCELKNSGTEELTLLHCTTSYPCPHDEVNLRAMLSLRDRFKVCVGYSDHTMGSEVALAAVALGAEVIEKHFTLDRNMPGPDHIASTEPGEFRELVDGIRNIERALGNGEKLPTEAERKIRSVVTKRIIARNKIKKGDVISPDDITTKRNMTGLPAVEWDKVAGHQAVRGYCENEPIDAYGKDQ